MKIKINIRYINSINYYYSDNRVLNFLVENNIVNKNAIEINSVARKDYFLIFIFIFIFECIESLCLYAFYV